MKFGKKVEGVLKNPALGRRADIDHQHDFFANRRPVDNFTNSGIEARDFGPVPFCWKNMGSFGSGLEIGCVCFEIFGLEVV